MADRIVDLEKVLYDFVGLLNKIGLPYMIVGGLAVNYYGQIRTTEDIDIVASVKLKDIPGLLKALKEKKYKFHREEISALVRMGNRFAIADPSDTYRIDFWIPKFPYENQAFDRRRKTKIGNKTLYLICPEDLVLFKLLAGRYQDEIDAVGVLKRQKGKLDRKYLKFWAMYLKKHKDLKELEKK
jgi:hypothetical protein